MSETMLLNVPLIMDKIRSMTHQEQKVRDSTGRVLTMPGNIYAFKEELLIQLSGLPGLKMPWGIRDFRPPSGPSVKECPILVTEEFVRLVDNIKGHLCEMKGYNPDGFTSLRSLNAGSVFYPKIHTRTRFHNLVDDNIVQVPISSIVPNSTIVPVVHLKGFYVGHNRWNLIWALMDGLVIPPPPVVEPLLYKLLRGSDCRVLPSACSGEIPSAPLAEPVPSAPLAEPAPQPAPLVELPSTTCAICIDAEISHVFMPCAHFCACRDCARRCIICPICRAPVTAIRDWKLISVNTKIFRV